MQITELRIRKVDDEGKLRAYVTVTFDNCFVVHNVKIIEGKSGLFMAMPSRKTANGEYKDVAHPISPEFRTELQDKIIAEYEDVLHRDKFSFDCLRVDEIIDFIRTRGQNISPAESDSEDFPDPDDKVFYCVALAAQNDSAALVTGNVRHFPSAPFVVTPAEFAERLGTF